MSTLKIYGASDDLAEFRGHADGEVGCYDSTVSVLIGSGDTALGVFIRHSGSLGWVVGTCMPNFVDEDKWAPPAATLTTHRYSPMLTVELAEGCPVRCMVNGEEREIA